MESPRYRCAVEVGFLPKGQEIDIAKDGFRTRFNTRVEQGDEFAFDGPPGTWMEPLNEAAIAKAEEAMKAKKRKQVGAVHAAPTEPLQVPRSGIAGGVSPVHVLENPSVDPRVAAQHSAPRRRAAARTTS